MTEVSADETMTSYAALMAISDIHYQAQSNRYPEGECAVCFRYDSGGREIVGERFPCPTRILVAKGLGLDDASVPFIGRRS